MKQLNILRTLGTFVLSLLMTVNLVAQDRIAYVSSTADPYPWGQTGLITNQMNMVFGNGNWEDLRFETVDPDDLFSNDFCLVYLEGSSFGANGLNSFIQANVTAMENYVNRGGRLLINAAPNQGGNINYGFGGVVLQYPNFQNSVTAFDPDHPIWQGPFTPTATSMTGNSYGHGVVCPAGMNATPLIQGGGQDVAIEFFTGAGLVIFGGMTTTNWHQPQPAGDNVRMNILHYLKNASLDGEVLKPLSGGTSVPTMTQWGKFLFGLVVLTFGVVAVYNIYTRKEEIWG